MKVHRLTLAVADRPGVLARICTVLHRYGTNIHALVVSNHGSSARVEMTLRCDFADVDLICARLRNLYDVTQVAPRTRGDATAMEEEE